MNQVLDSVRKFFSVEAHIEPTLSSFLRADLPALPGSTDYIKKIAKLDSAIARKRVNISANYTDETDYVNRAIARILSTARSSIDLFAQNDFEHSFLLVQEIQNAIKSHAENGLKVSIIIKVNDPDSHSEILKFSKKLSNFDNVTWSNLSGSIARVCHCEMVTVDDETYILQVEDRLEIESNPKEVGEVKSIINRHLTDPQNKKVAPEALGL